METGAEKTRESPEAVFLRQKRELLLQKLEVTTSCRLQFARVALDLAEKKGFAYVLATGISLEKHYFERLQSTFPYRVKDGVQVHDHDWKSKAPARILEIIAASRKELTLDALMFATFACLPQDDDLFQRCVTRLSAFLAYAQNDRKQEVVIFPHKTVSDWVMERKDKDCGQLYPYQFERHLLSAYKALSALMLLLVHKLCVGQTEDCVADKDLRLRIAKQFLQLPLDCVEPFVDRRLPDFFDPEALHHLLFYLFKSMPERKKRAVDESNLVQKLLTDCGALFYLRQHEASQADNAANLRNAILLDLPEVVACLVVDVKADINGLLPSRLGAETPLTLAARRGSADIVKLLLESRADGTARNEAGLNAVQCALRHDHNACLEHLIAKLLCSCLTCGNKRIASVGVCLCCLLSVCAGSRATYALQNWSWSGNYGSKARGNSVCVCDGVQCSYREAHTNVNRQPGSCELNTRQARSRWQVSVRTFPV